MKIYTFDTVVVGSGAAGYSAACRLRELNAKSVCIVTEGVNSGTSRNTGSDKQTYYKLGLAGDAPDSVRKMADDLFRGGCVDGDNALCEAALSPRCFYKLCELGVEFPCNRYGEFIGYKTDHDPFARATSAGPLTSKFMTEALEKQAEKLEIEVFDRLYAVEILRDESGVCGLLCVDTDSGEFAAFKCANVVLATGGPAGIYADSVYPVSQNGSTALAVTAGAALQNMTEWQYGLASTDPRWNVSGTYMQVLPRFVSVDERGCEHEFLADFFDDAYTALSCVFLKGYQWPFDVNKVQTGSSVIDLLVYKETVLGGRRVYLDYTKNPFELDEIDFAKLDGEAYQYLKNADACFGKPIDRLLKMNQPAVALYQSKGVDLTRQPLEIALCAQHNNGGIAVDKWWQTRVDGLFAVGECAGTHGITRPGGSALNAGQVGALRAAQWISASERKGSDGFEAVLAEALDRHGKLCEAALNHADNTHTAIQAARREMSAHGAAIRDAAGMKALYAKRVDALRDFSARYGVAERGELCSLYRLRDVLMTQSCTLGAMLDYAGQAGASRGSALYTDENGVCRAGLDEIFRHTAGRPLADQIQQIEWRDGEAVATWRAVRAIPQEDDFFENVWQRYREDKNIY